MTNGLLGLRTYSGETLRHRHDHHQIVLPHRGRLELEIDGRGGCVAAGVGAFIAAGAWHGFLSRDDNAFLVLDAPDAAWPAPERSAFFPVTPAIQGLLDYATARLEAGAPAASLQEAWAVLLQDSLTPAAPPARGEAALRRAMGFMRAHLAEPIGVADIAAAAGLSPTRLHAAFRDRLGSSPHATLARLRLDAAQRLLASSTLPIAEIALRTGHADQSALTRRLRRARGITPALFRRLAAGAVPAGKAQDPAGSAKTPARADARLRPLTATD
ncbi:AraC family transcriptional regulator [Rhodovastum atsumiense]|uniref:AraC family transcriptional regulator n=1 Tax=Rhodovastum atsumiense TaxID=504468 RepID=A0A5M6ILK9_9PROT|nr:AraC family transcriptional regulator [Rhodovastum atsumiense]KAA5609062.1 AraC family transcriptional regulator [Rhodovastum atsumiense]CAH2602188.1 AraC family transcriptional regulator [Rhodovastum atsumiense]